MAIGVTDSNIHHEILKGDYECLICLGSITRQSIVWSCRTCFRVFDLNCIKEWGERALKARGGWSCPHCLVEQKQKVNGLQYRCWCGKQKLGHRKSYRRPQGTKYITDENQINQDVLDFPHSCGQTCGAKRSCPHPCPLTCHAGQHARSEECAYLGPKISCFCGKANSQSICSQTPYEGFSCAGDCGRIDRICKHKCKRTCHRREEHSNGCGPCEELVQIKCFCGAIESEKRPCHTLSKNERNRVNARGQLTLSCGRICDEELSCANHRCMAKCHGRRVKHTCDLVPRAGETCFCGKQRINRQSCLDPYLSCGSVCGKRLACGHTCQQECHEGSCPACMEVLENVPCRCTATFGSILCSDSQKLRSPTCSKKCGALMSCRRHRCQEFCCSAKPLKSPGHSARGRALDLQQFLADQQILGPGGTEEDNTSRLESHVCTRMCDRLLSCGSHTCPSICHAGPCSPCMATSFDEWACSCGSTVVEPPIRCGTEMPACRAACHRPQTCGHSAQHRCHPDVINCSPCSVLVLKACRCGKSEVKVKCSSLNEVDGAATQNTCARVCGTKLGCGHYCKQTCCNGGGSCPPCQEPCGRAFSCGHKHMSGSCHPGVDCPDECTTKLMARCPCGSLNVEYDCGEDVEVGCNDFCLKETYPVVLQEAYQEEKRWFLRIEATIRDAVKAQNSRTIWFKPMNKRHRRYVYYLLDHYGLQGESVDTGSNRSVRAVFTDSVYLCRHVLQNGSFIEPRVYLDQIVPLVEETSDDGADSALHSADMILNSDFIVEEVQDDFIVAKKGVGSIKPPTSTVAKASTAGRFDVLF